MSGDGVPAVAVWQRWIDRFTGQWAMHLERPIDRKDLHRDRIASSLPSFGFFVLLVTSAMLASFGLLADSAAVVIGAMIVAPLMNPILSMAFAIVIGDGRLVKRSLVTLVLGVVVVVITAMLIALLLPVSIVGSEILARATPNLIDLGIAVAAGVAGAFSLTRARIANSIAGVAIAVALVPPLCVTGIGLLLGPEVGASFGQDVVSGLNLDVSQGAFLLFLANLIGITVAGSLTFLSQSYGSWRRSWQPLMAWLALMAVISGPLSFALQEFILAKRIDIELSRIAAEDAATWRQVQVRYINIDVAGRAASLDLVLNAPEGLLSDAVLARTNEALFRSLLRFGIRDLDLHLRIVPVRVKDFRDSLSEPGNS
ncbi:DUF389 domain-containing protein [Synechococcus sp. RSCCF101]|uniref:DUF389 domain-containing protein n=1 Tax=Synechococcus sp. RSCCF101 TaxID=2511069 RepID=UPI001248664F|nr:DUF389 domain-containing protein [Synechococcus sp. RSCCF101]QEY33409.1 DUF389 domain-containing protein [Synechococcus sp. RSCCF101]